MLSPLSARSSAPARAAQPSQTPAAVTAPKAVAGIAVTDVWRPADEPDPIPDPPSEEGPTIPRDSFKESFVGSALHTIGAGAVGGGIGFLVGGPMGAAVGAGIGTVAAQGFMQVLTRFADGGQPRAAAMPGIAAGVGAAVGGLVWGAGAAAWGMLLAPAALLGAFYGARALVNRIHG